ncbi:MAG: hypothetical protein LUQ35_03260 [Methanoregula sp.]|nr:hypothetical protein [Methanoregula sp.]
MTLNDSKARDIRSWGLRPAAWTSPVAIVLYYLIGHYCIVPHPPTGDWWRRRGEIITP